MYCCCRQVESCGHGARHVHPVWRGAAALCTAAGVECSHGEQDQDIVAWTVCCAGRGWQCRKLSPFGEELSQHGTCVPLELMLPSC